MTALPLLIFLIAFSISATARIGLLLIENIQSSELPSTISIAVTANPEHKTQVESSASNNSRVKKRTWPNPMPGMWR